jgi:hypothetical protein
LPWSSDLGDQAPDPDLLEVERHQGRGVDALAQAHHHDVEVADAQGVQPLLVPGVQDHGAGREIRDGLHVFRVDVDGQHVMPCLVELLGDVEPEPAQSDDGDLCHGVNLA